MTFGQFSLFSKCIGLDVSFYVAHPGSFVKPFKCESSSFLYIVMSVFIFILLDGTSFLFQLVPKIDCVPAKNSTLTFYVPVSIWCCS